MKGSFPWNHGLAVWRSSLTTSTEFGLEIAADLPKGATDQVIQTVTENSRTLKFDTHEFERE